MAAQPRHGSGSAPASARRAQLGDARSGKFADNLHGFCRALRRAGLPVDPDRIALAQQAVVACGLSRQDDVSAACEAVLVSRESDRHIFREMFEAWFRNPALAKRLLAQMLPRAEGPGPAPKRRPRVREALAAPQPAAGSDAAADAQLQFDAAMSAGNLRRLRQADFNALGAAEYALVQRLARDIPLALPRHPVRRLRAVARAAPGVRLHGAGALKAAAATGGELVRLPGLKRRREVLPLLVLVDVSGSMERYARLLLAFLHAATRDLRRRDVFAFGTELTDLLRAFALNDPDAMLAAAGLAIQDFAGGTQLGGALASLRRHHAGRLVARRTVVLLISDGLDTGEPDALDAELQWLTRHARLMLWLNPLLRFDGYAPLARGAAALHRHADAMVAVHNLEALEQLGSRLATLVRRG